MIELTLDSLTQTVTVNDPSPTPSVLWDQIVQQAVINTGVGPTVASRAYAIVHTAMFDAWASYDPTAIGTQIGDDLQRPIAENTDANKTQAMSFAAHQVLTELFPTQVQLFDDLMVDLGFDPDDENTNTSTPTGIGNVTGEKLLEFRREDGSNQLGDDPDGTFGVPYSDTIGYVPRNTADNIVDMEAWTPERVPIDAEPGEELRIQEFLTPQWGQVTPFAIGSGRTLRVEPPKPFLLDDSEVNLEAKTIRLEDDTVVDITPDLVGTVINPEFIEQVEEVVEFSANLTDRQKLIAEFWEDGSGSSFPPGTWMTFGQFVSANDDNTIDEDAVLFTALGNAVFDAGITTWDSKVFYDYVRPVRAIRELGRLGLIGEFNEDLGGFAIEATLPNEGTQTILATDFLTYQPPGGDPSPPFAEYTSGHSTFSSAAATVLELFTGDGVFGASVTIDSGQSRFEPGLTPSEPVTLEWDTFREAADEAGISRLFGGIHFQDGDLNGRATGVFVGEAAWEQTLFFANGGFNDLNGTTEDNDLTGTTDADLITALDGNDTVRSGDRNDEIKGGAGNDRLYGDEGNDLVNGGSDRDFLSGGLGNDTLAGGSGNDSLYGDQGNDTLLGNEDSDFLLGLDGNDFLDGGLGSDRVFGGAGNDTFVLRSGDGRDIFYDFTDGEDSIYLKDGLTFADLSFEEFNGNPNFTEIIGLDSESLALLSGVSPSELNESDFSLI